MNQSEKAHRKVCAIVVALVAIAACAGAHAATMCMASDTVAVILDPDIGPTSYTYSEISNGNGTWDVTAPYGHVTGIATCNSTSGSYATAYPQYNFEQGTEGRYCWCQMLRPARSAWVCGAGSSASDCAANCAFYCSYYVRLYAAFRGGVFGSAGI